MVMLASGSDVARAGTAGLMAAPSKIPIPKVKKKQKVKLGGIPSKSADVGAVAKYEASKSLLASPSPKVKAALGSIEGAGETNRSASAIEGVPVPSDLSPLRSLAITLARNELGKIDSNPSPPRTEPWSLGHEVKIGAVRLAEYNAVAYGTNAGQWANYGTLTALVSAGKKHTTWCGIFALWAVKMGAGVTASNYRGYWDVLGEKFPQVAPLLAFIGSLFIPEPDGSMPDKNRYKKLQWAPGGIYLYHGQDLDPLKAGKEEDKQLLSPTPIKNWLLRKKTVPPIRPGDIGYTREPIFKNGVRQAGLTNHHYIVERVMEVDGKYVYFTIEGNYFSHSTTKNQAVVRNYRVYDPSYDPTKAASGRHVIESFYDIELLPRPEDNRHALPTAQPP